MKIMGKRLYALVQRADFKYVGMDNNMFSF